MLNFRVYIACLFGPRLYKLFKLEGNTLSTRTPEVLSATHNYVPNKLESVPDSLIKVVKIFASFGKYFSFFLLCYVFHRRYTGTPVEVQTQVRIFGTALAVYAASFCVRGYGRYTNQEYLSFLKVLKTSQANLTPSNKRILNKFDYEFYACPIDFKWTEGKDTTAPIPYHKSFPSRESKYEIKTSIGNPVIKACIVAVGNVIMQTVGKRIIYPGTLGFLQTLMSPAIKVGRRKLIEEHDGVRFKLLSYTGDELDTLLVDRRSLTPNHTGNTLVIGCEGNGGFYEIGTILTPLEANYSVLGWNHPGFGDSTGFPYPDNEVAAVDTVVRFAVEKLKFPVQKIILYGWSIGGFAATWAGMRHPDVNGLVIDASFDHILPLARKVVPFSFLEPLTEIAIQKNFDLNNARHLENYKGPITIIRRSQDEVISLDPYNSPQTNRANNLLLALLEQRFPMLIDEKTRKVIVEFCAGNSRYQESVLVRYCVNSRSNRDLLAKYFRENPTGYPVNIGTDMDDSARNRLALFLASKHLLDYDSVHCTPLPPRYFSCPFNLFELVTGSRL